jgi:hypothetical protein
MFDIFKKDIKVGDKVKLYLTTGKEPVGIVSEIGDNFVLLKGDDSVSNRFFDKLIGGWDIIISSSTFTSIEKTEKDIGSSDQRNTNITPINIDGQFLTNKAQKLLQSLNRHLLDKVIAPNANIIKVKRGGFSCIGSDNKHSSILIPHNKILDEELVKKIESFQLVVPFPVILNYISRNERVFVNAVVPPGTIESLINRFIYLIEKNRFKDASSLLDIFKMEIGYNKTIIEIIGELKKVRSFRQQTVLPKVEAKEKKQPSERKAFKSVEKEINDLISQSMFEKALSQIELELRKQIEDSKYVSSLLLKRAQIFSSLDKPEESESAYHELIQFNEKIHSPANNLSHLYTELGRLQSLKVEKLQEAAISIRKALKLNPGNSYASNLLKQIEKKVGHIDNLENSNIENANDELVIDIDDESNTISKLIDVDIKEHKFTHADILKNGGKPTSYIAKKILDEAKKTRDVDLSETYPLYLEAAKAFSELNVGSYDLSDYQEAAAYYSLLKGNSLYLAFRKSVTRSELELTRLTRLKDSSSSYYFEALNLLSNIEPASLLVVLANYLRLNIIIYNIRKANQNDFSSLFEMQFADIFTYCLKNKNHEIEEIAFKAILECGASSINAWNKLSNAQKGTGRLYDEFYYEHQRKRIYQIINRINIEAVSEEIKPSEFLKNSFQLRAKQKSSFITSFNDMNSLEFTPVNFRSILKKWEQIFSNNRFLTDTDMEVEKEIKNIISIIQPYLNRKQIERTNILIQTNGIIQKRLSFINENTTYYGRTLFYGLLVKWKREIDELLKEKIAQSFPSLSVIIDPPYYVTTDGQESIPIIIKNEGEATSEGFFLRIALESTVYQTSANTTFESKTEIPAGNQGEAIINIPNELLHNSNAVELTIDAQAIYQSKRLPIKKFQLTVEKEPSTSLGYDDIPWRDGPIPSKDLFKGRKRLVADLAQHYLSIERDKPYILYGLTRTGKSSVLEYLKKDIGGNTFFSKGSNYKIITFSWELNEAASQANASDFYYYILYQQTYEVLEKYFRTNNLSFDGLKIDDRKVRFRDFKIILDFLAEKKLFPLFLIDEFSFIKNLMDKGTIDSAFLHSLRQFALNGLASFAFAGTYDIKQLIKNPNYGITGQLVNTIEYQVNEIGDEAAEELIEVISDKLSFTPEAIDHIRFLSGNIPYFIQIICKHCGNYAVEKNRRYIGYPELEKVIRILIGQEESSTNSLVKKLPEGTFQNNQFSPADPKEVSALISSIVHFNKNELKPRGIGAHELEKLWADRKLGSYKQKLAEAISILLEKKILIQEEDEGLPVYKFSVDLFRRWWGIHNPDINLALMMLTES